MNYIALHSNNVTADLKIVFVILYSSDIAMGTQPVDDIEPGDSVSNQGVQSSEAARRGSDMSGIPGTTVTEILEIPDHTRLEHAYHDQLNSVTGVPPVHPTESVRSLGDIHVNHGGVSMSSSLTHLPSLPHVSQVLTFI